MKPSTFLATFLLIAISHLLAPAANAQNDSRAVNCFEVVEALNFALQGLPQEGVTAISLKDQGETRYIVLVALEKKKLDTSNNTGASWRIIERQKDSLIYCLSGAGRTLEILGSLHRIPGFGAEFGLPGTSKRRCNDESDGELGSVAVRSWANKELGPSMVQFFGTPFKGTAFTVLLADNSFQGYFPWIVLQSDGKRNCYFARGNDSAFTNNFAMKAELRQDPSTLAPLE